MKTSAQAKHMILGQIMTNEVTDPRILQAMAQLDRNMFVPVPLRGAAYVDEDLPIGNGRFLIEPLTLAKLITLASIDQESRVLVIGALNGYGPAVVSHLAKHVVAIEQDEALLQEAQSNLKLLAIDNVDLQQVKQLTDGFTPLAPYDAIIIAGAVNYIPDSLAMQLALHGKLVAVRNITSRPGSAHGLGKGVLVKRVGAELEYTEHFDTATAILPGFEQKPGFVF